MGLCAACAQPEIRTEEMMARLLKRLGTDGLLHIVVSAALSAVLSLLVPRWVAAAVTLAVGVAKEVRDKVSGRGCAEWKDLLCDVAGVVIGVC